MTNEVTKVPQAVKNGVVNIQGKHGSLKSGDSIMKALLFYYNVSWGNIKLSSGQIEKLPGLIIHAFVTNSAMVIRGLYNCHPLKLESYETDSLFSKFKAGFIRYGRFPGLPEVDFNKSSLVKMMLSLTGLTIDFVVEIRQYGIHTSVHQILGSMWINHFRTYYCQYSELGDHYELLCSKLPTFCRLPANLGVTIFKTSRIHRDILIRKDYSFDIPQPR